MALCGLHRHLHLHPKNNGSPGFTVEEAIPTGLLGAILITFPENFGHAIEKASSVVSLSEAISIEG